MKLTKPLVFLDIETTGLSLKDDRIIEISMIKLYMDNTKNSYYKRINPEGREISEDAYIKHNIKLDDLRDCPTFKDVAKEIHYFINDCDIAGFNCKTFDIPILIEEFLRANIMINIKKFKIVDVYKIINKLEPRTLRGSYKRFIGKEMKDVHDAEDDVLATIELFKKIKELYNLPDTVNELDEFAFGDDTSFDLENKLKLKNNKLVFNFGKYKDKTVNEIYNTDKDYIDWLIYNSDLTQYTKCIIGNIKKRLENGSNM